ncbi:MAG: hypothetical protein RLZZ210_1735 [Pseudomonadota bacterium]|jgi:glycosyltransferase involved in cell wall biosynthesis
MEHKKTNYPQSFMHIAFVANTAWSVYNFRKNILSYLLEQGHKVTVIAPFDDKVINLQSMGCNCIDIKMQRQGTSPISDSMLTYNLYKIYRQIKPDFIFHYTIKPNIYGSIAAKFAGIKNSIAVTTGLGSVFIKQNWVTTVAKILYKYSLKYAKYIYFLNNDDLNKFVECDIIPACKAKLLAGEGIDTNFFAPQTKFKLQQTTTSFLLIARMLKDKGIVEYIESAKILKQKYDTNVSFNLLGACDEQNPNGISKEQIMQWHNQGFINYLGTTDDVRGYIQNSDCIVLPSYAEGIPRTLLEGASMQKPLIASDVSGCREVVKHEYNGYLCSAKNIDDLVLCLDKFINLDSNAKQTMGINARNHVIENFSDSNVIKEYISLLTQV